MQIIYINRGASPSRFAAYMKQYNNNLQQQGQKYNQLLMEGLSENGAKVFSISTRPINRSITKKIYFKAEKEQEKGIFYDYVPFLNMKILRDLSVFCGVFVKTLFFRGNKKDTVVVCDALNISATIAAQISAAMRGFKTIGIVTDVPCHYSNMDNISFGQKLNLWIMRKFKGYLLLTEQMNNVVNSKNRPHVVLEGHSDLSMEQVENRYEEKQRPKVCLYAGSVMKIYGIADLVNGFIEASIPNTELHIYGNGDFGDELKTIAQRHPTVKYMGVAPNSEVVKAELAATLLVNPRPSKEEYTKYSFPSKNMEYMASGTPVLTTRLPGMPKDHEPYMYFIEEESVQGVAKALKYVLAKDAQELHEFGLKAKHFALTRKSNKAQAEKLIYFIKNSFRLEN